VSPECRGVAGVCVTDSIATLLVVVLSACWSLYRLSCQSHVNNMLDCCYSREWHRLAVPAAAASERSAAAGLVHCAAVTVNQIWVV
jgi:hypothetical protein